MLWNSFDRDREILENQYSPKKFNENSGLSIKIVLENAKRINDSDLPDAIKRAEIIKYILTNSRIGITPEDFFADRIEATPQIIGDTLRAEAQRQYNKEISDILHKNALGQELLYYTGDSDFSHTSPYWHNVLALGLSGMKKRAENKEGDFFKSIVIACEGAEIFFRRLSREAKEQKREAERMEMLSSALISLTEKPPQNTYEALLLMYLFFILQSEIECSYLRAFGSLDMLLYPFYKKDIEEGRFTREQIRVLIKYFIVKLNALKVWANQPFALGGVEGQDSVNELSYIILEEFIKLRPAYAKIHIRYSKELPKDFIMPILESIRQGGNSFVFINNSVAWQALALNGQEQCDTVDYGIVGCYEIFSQGKELPCSCNGRINLLKAVEAVIFEGKDALTQKQVLDALPEPKTFEDFLNSVKHYLKVFIDNTVEVTNAYERGYEKIHFAPFLSMTYDSSIEKGIDIYKGGAKYNSSSINLLGTASCADSLYAIKTLVYDRKTVTLKEMRDILKNNWQGYEELRRIALNLPKYGNNFDQVDLIARDIQDFCAEHINGRKNSRNGTYRMGTFSIDWRMEFGKRTGASPDGRKEKEPLSKNICASPALDRRGITAHVLSASKLDSLKVPNGTVLDLALHFSAVSGDDGIMALKATLDTYMQKGGFAVQYNVLDPSVLRDAQREPEKYSNLQVRLCGWNAPFTQLTKKEQDEFILQGESQ